jgi:hypothetical protein
MKEVRQSKGGIGSLHTVLKRKKTVVTRASFWRVPHNSGKTDDINLKIGRYKNEVGAESPEVTVPKSELTLDNEEFLSLVKFIGENYAPLIDGVKKYIPLDQKFDGGDIEHIKALFENPDKTSVLKFINENSILPRDILLSLDQQKRVSALEDFERMLGEDLTESSWQKWFKENHWVLGTEFVKILDERSIDTAHVSDYLMQAYDGFVDVVEIKRPGGGLTFWANSQDHGNDIPSPDLTKAITQANRYVYELEREANSVKFLERIEYVKTVKPRCVLVFGRSADWTSSQNEAYRIVNSSYHNLAIMTYDHVLARAKRILGLESPPRPMVLTPVEITRPPDTSIDDIPF